MISYPNAVKAKWKCLVHFFPPSISIIVILPSRRELKLHFVTNLAWTETFFGWSLVFSDKKLHLIFASGNKYRSEPELVLFWFQFLQFCWQRESQRLLKEYWIKVCIYINIEWRKVTRKLGFCRSSILNETIPYPMAIYQTNTFNFLNWRLNNSTLSFL